MIAPDSDGPMVDLVCEVALGTSLDTFTSAITAIVNYEGVDALKKVKVPTLLLASLHNKVGRPAEVKESANHISQADFVCIPGAAHYAFVEQHELFNQHLLRFIKDRVQAA